MRYVVIPAMLTLAFGPSFAQKPALTDEQILKGAPERIERYRKADIVVRVTDRRGKPIGGAKVHVRQTRHAFLFGCNAFPLLTYKDSEKEALFEKRFTDLLNYATLGFYWGAFEPRPGETAASMNRLRRQAQWLKAHNVEVKGHPLVWHNVYPSWAPKDADSAKPLLEKRITNLVTGFAGLIDRWDVINEATVSAKESNGVGDWVKRDGTAKVVSQCLEWAHTANPKAVLLYNDFNLGKDYEDLAKKLVDTKEPVSAFGIQSHMHGGEWPMTRVWEDCETYARFGKPLHFTETSVLSGEHGWEKPAPWPTTRDGEARQAEYVTRFYTVLFSHPAVHAITWWDMMDGQWMGAPSGLVRADLSPKPAYAALLKLIKHDWWTDATLTTGKDGTAKLRGFLGEYEITCGSTTVTSAVVRGRVNKVKVRL